MNDCNTSVVIFAVVLFSRISRVSPRENFHFNIWLFKSNENITKIVKLSHREFPHLVQQRENIKYEKYIVAGATKPLISKMLNVQESQKNMAALTL